MKKKCKTTYKARIKALYEESIANILFIGFFLLIILYAFSWLLHSKTALEKQKHEKEYKQEIAKQ